MTYRRRCNCISLDNQDGRKTPVLSAEQQAKLLADMVESTERLKLSNNRLEESLNHANSRTKPTA